MKKVQRLLACAAMLAALTAHAGAQVPPAQAMPQGMTPGMMGGGMMNSAPAPLPGRDLTAGARLTGEYCSQCHRAPLPGREPPLAWPGILKHMQAYMQKAGGQIRQPTAAEISQIAAYLEGHPWQ
ncbi:c-type cytochrome [Crenobacter intestini]|uniref:Cytochrome c n=1 Tax=Crenobacter intestini TaxID=2563443 RepID=A0A4T0UVS5_9NEIS|nr:cytochrome c [Crenobacter intestini]TIC83179.1 cytochrome c [Crenobacter intestini]